jgi:DNA-binding transcriptional LysR family regulator
VSLAEVQTAPMVVRERGSGSRAALEHALGESGTQLAAFRVVGEMGSTQAIKQAVRAGVGISIISKRAVQDECRAGYVACLEIERLAVNRAFYLITHRDRTRSPLGLAFLAFLESQFPPPVS